MAEGSSPALLAFSIGPVQEYISAARRSQDLYVGSVLLSQLTNAACSKAGWEHVLYPAQPPSEQVDYAPLPNRFIARYDSIDVAVVAANQAEEAARAHWSGVAARVRVDIASRVRPLPADWAVAWEDQVNNYLDITWAVVPVPDGVAYDLSVAWAALEARRRLHAFAPLQAQHGYKCSIFSGLSAMGPGHDKVDQSFSDLRDFWQGLAAAVSSAGIAIVLRPDGRERLSALACVKRFASFTGDPRLTLAVPSTSSIAAATYKAALLQRLVAGDERLVELLVTYLDTLLVIYDQTAQGEKRRSIRQMAGDDRAIPYLHGLAQKVPGQDRCKKLILRYDGDLFFAETLTANRLYGDYGLEVSDGPSARTGWKDISTQLRAARTALTELLRYTTKQLLIAPPTRYYAVLMMDGDHMGELFRRIKDPAAHQEVSRTLSTFAAAEVRNIVEREYPGKLIYAGGDDVLALLPLADALAITRRLQEAYHIRLGTGLESLAPGAPSPTASVGLAIAHHQAALDQVLAEARRAEKAAKNDYQRNSLSIHALKRSGAPLRVGLHYSEPGQPVALDPLAAVQLLIEADVLSPRFAYSFAREARSYADGDTLAAMVGATLYRLLGRQGEPGDLFTFWKANAAGQAARLGDLLGLESYEALTEQLFQNPDNEQKPWLAQRIYRPLAERLASIATGLQARSLQAVEQAERARQKWPECPPLSQVENTPTAAGALALADWLLLVAFLTRGGAE